MSEGSFEAKVSAKRETNAGIFLTLQIHPDDYKSELATLRVGSALMMGWAEVVDTKVEPITVEPAPPQHAKVDASKERRPFASMPLSQQAAIRCQDSQFQDFLSETMSSVRRGRENWTWADEVRTRCACRESRSEIAADTTQGRLWVQLEADYQEWLTTQRYGSLAR